MQNKIFLRWVLSICFMMISEQGFAKIVELNINNGISNGSIFIKNENVKIGDRIRFTNNLGYTLNMQNNSFISDMSSLGGNGNINVHVLNILPGDYYEIQLTSTTQTQFYFIHSNSTQHKHYNNQLNLTYNTALGVSETEKKAKEKIEIFPNPCTDLLSIKSKQRMTALELYDAAGKLLIVKKRESSKSENRENIDMSPYLKGSYFLRIKSSDGSDCAILVKKE